MQNTQITAKHRLAADHYALMAAIHEQLAQLSERGTGRHTPCLSSEQLFGHHVSICITNGGERYQLRRTRHNKLILTK